MDEAAREYIAAIGTRIAALSRAKATFLAGAPGAAASVQRLVHMVRITAAASGFERLASLAENAERADAASLSAALDPLIAAMQSVAESQSFESDAAVILLVEDDIVSQTLMQHVLAGTARRFVPVSTIAGAESVLASEDVTLIILDLVLPDGDGRNFLVRIREDARTASVPVIVISAFNNAQVRSECHALGCDAYVSKPFEIDVLTRTTASLLARAGSQERAIRVDSLTGLANRAAIRNAIEATAPNAERSAIAIVDLDHFAVVNERIGRAGGDAALKAFSAFVSAALRPSDELGRWGGEEFVMLLPRTGVQSAAAALTNIQERLASLALLPDFPDLRVSFTAGVAEVGGGVSAADALTEGERLLFHGKENGRGMVVTTTEQATPAVRTILLAEDDPVIAALVRHRLERDGYLFEHAANGTDAYERATKGQLALIITDVNMPGIGGFDLIKRLRQLPATARTPIVMLTSMGSEADIARALALGANDYIVKPFSPIELVARVRRLVARG